MKAYVADGHRLITRGQFARLLKVGKPAVAKWAASGRLACVDVEGAGPLYRESDALAMIAGTYQPPGRAS